ncbi:MAG: SH3 domain-containing protein [bacterium]|nr:SH3 domain-containing protein [bacterium]
MNLRLPNFILLLIVCLCLAILITGCAKTRVAKKPIIIEPAEPVPPPEPPPAPLPPPPPEPESVTPAPPPPPEPVVVIPSVPPSPPPPPPKPVAPPAKKPALQFATVTVPPISILGKKISTVDILTAPGPNNPVVAQVSDKTRVQIISKTANNWYKIKLPDGRVGWISGNFLIIPVKTSP